MPRLGAGQRRNMKYYTYASGLLVPVCFAGADERSEDFSLRRVAVDEEFRMPLNAEDESVRGALDAFHDAVLGGRADDEVFTRRLHRLVMGGIDFQARLADDLAQFRVRVNRNHVPAAVLDRRALVLDAVRVLRVDVLIQRAAEGHVDRLCAAADSEQRHIAPK